LQLFRQICAAVQYAHQRLIVHRDIKPGNVLVTREGEVKLMDFGIAKVLQEGGAADQTQAGFGAMTPDYASPEQLGGETVTTQTDVYSLGVLLYELLTGKRPYAATGKSLGELRKIVDEAEPPRAGLPDELLAIVRYAMAKDAGRRYPSASALEDDVARYLGGRPVRAVSPSRWYALRKWTGRHRLPVLAGAAAAILILAATSFALRSAAEARRERALAEQRFRDVRRLANKVLFEYPVALRQMNASTALQVQMATDSLRYLDDLARTRSSDPEILLELARGYTHVGAILGTPRAGNVGRPEKAFEAYAKARGILQDLLERNRDLWAARRQLAAVLRELSQLDKRNAPELARQSLAVWEDVYRRRPQQHDLFGLGWAHVRLAELDLQPGHARQAMEFLERFREGKPKDPKGLPEQAYANRLLARALLAQNDPDSALAAAQTGKTLDEQARSLLSNDAAYRMELSLDLETMALAHLQQNRLAVAMDCFQQAATLRRKVLQTNAGDEWVQQRTLDILCWLGWTAERQRNWHAADATYREAVKLAPTFTAVQKNDEWNAVLGFVYGSEGLLLVRHGQRAGCDLLVRSAQYFRATHDFDDPVFRDRAAEVERAAAACSE
jgi:tetratricopeptide (TPR) repeat protein